VSGAGYDVDHLDQPRAGLPLRADIHMTVPDNSYDRMYF
jgi:hypothetical protein